MPQVKMLLFAALREAAGTDAVTAEPASPRTTVGEVWAAACQEHPRLEPWRNHVRLARNGEYVPPSTLVIDGDELAAIPPVSGG